MKSQQSNTDIITRKSYIMCRLNCATGLSNDIYFRSDPPTSSQKSTRNLKIMKFESFVLLSLRKSSHGIKINIELKRDLPS